MITYKRVHVRIHMHKSNLLYLCSRWCLSTTWKYVYRQVCQNRDKWYNGGRTFASYLLEISPNNFDLTAIHTEIVESTQLLFSFELGKVNKCIHMKVCSLLLDLFWFTTRSLTLSISLFHLITLPNSGLHLNKKIYIAM